MSVKCLQAGPKKASCVAISYQISIVGKQQTTVVNAGMSAYIVQNAGLIA